MLDLVNQINQLKKSKVKNVIDSRIRQFKNNGNNSNEHIFKELCFCLLTANFDAEKCLKIQQEIGDSFLKENREHIEKRLRDYGHRFPNKRAEYITKSIHCLNRLNKVIHFQDKNSVREWFVNNIKGFGYKEASHFLRNIGFEDYAIIDYHIIDILVKNNIIARPKSITKKNYLEIEKKLSKIASITNLNLAELDLYLWYLETGKILK
jgi:N-glycosylase/DNA lyase